MADVNNSEEIKKIDLKDVLGSTGFFIKQCREIHELVENFAFQQDFSNIRNIVVSGMGGSAYGGQVAAALLKHSLSIPVVVNNDYDLPEFVDENTLVLLTSYSGGTEETLASFEEAKDLGAKVICLTSGGKLGELTKENGYDAVIFEAKSNPSGQPRLGTGYIVLGTIEILRKIKLIDFDTNVIVNAIDEAEKQHEAIKELTKNDANKFQGYIPVIFAGEFLSGNAHILRNQFNETSKSFSSYHLLPEANHHLLEGLKNPGDKKLFTLFIESDLYSEKLKRRLELTKEVVRKNTISTYSYQPQSSSKLGQVLETLMFGGYMTFFLAILYDQDPSVIPWVDYFKEQLAKK